MQTDPHITARANHYHAKDRQLYLDGIQGDLKAAIQAHCLSCSRYERAIVKKCPDAACALFPHRLQ